MENKLEYFLTLIHLDNIEEFKNTKLLRVIVNNKDSLITIFLETERMISVDNYLKLKDQMENYFNSKVEIRINNLGDKSLYLEEYFKNFLPEYGKYFQDRLKINGDNNNYIVAYNQGEEREINNYLKGINTNLVNLGYNPLTVFVDEENRANIRKMINENLTNIEVKKTSEPSNFETKTFEPRRKKVKTVEDERVYLGEVIEGDTINIKDIVSEDNDLIIECEIFGVDIFESTKSNYKIITLKLTDYTDSMYAKVFTTDSEELKRLVGILKPSKWFKFKGYTKRDKYTMDEIVFNISSINVSDKKNVEITDLAPIKRVELHTHTMMSAMDGVCAVSKHGVSTIEQAIKWGHKAIAITDHSGCQAFPNAYNMIVDYNKGKPK